MDGIDSLKLAMRFVDVNDTWGKITKTAADENYTETQVRQEPLKAAPNSWSGLNVRFSDVVHARGVNILRHRKFVSEGRVTIFRHPEDVPDGLGRTFFYGKLVPDAHPTR